LGIKDTKDKNVGLKHCAGAKSRKRRGPEKGLLKKKGQKQNGKEKKDVKKGRRMGSGRIAWVKKKTKIQKGSGIWYGGNRE